MAKPSLVRRTHTMSASLFVLTGIAHTIGQYGPSPSDPATDAIVRALSTTRVAGASFTWWQVMMCWGALYGAMSFLFGVHALLVERSCGGDVRVVRASATVLMLAAAVQAAVAVLYMTTPPAFFMIPAAVLAAMAAFAPERAAS